MKINQLMKKWKAAIVYLFLFYVKVIDREIS